MRTEGFGLVAVEQHIEYKRELRAGDLLTIRSSVLEAWEKSVRFVHHVMDSDGSAKGPMLAVHSDSFVRNVRYGIKL
jgi:acyl-CoA thioester hydrolase